MNHHTHLEDKLGGFDNFQGWKYIISLILEEKELDQFITGDVPEPEGDEAKVDYKRSMDKAKRIIEYSIKGRLITHVSAFKTPNEVYDALKNMFKGKNTNRKMTLRNHFEECEDIELRDYTLEEISI